MAWSMRREQTSGDSRYGCCECLLSCSSSCSGRSDLCAHCSCWYSQLRSSGRTLQCASFAAPLGCMAASASHACAAAPAISAAAASSAAAVDAAARTPIAPKVSVDVGDGDESDGGATSGAFSAAAFAFALGSAGQHASVDVRGLGTLLSFSVHSFLIGWLLEYSFCLLRYLCVLTNLLASSFDTQVCERVS